jgi:hypothetical protein
MKTQIRNTGLVLAIAALGAMAYVRLAPTDPADWNASTAIYTWDHGGAWDQIVPMMAGATLRLSDTKGSPADLLSRLDTIAMATPRTIRLAGSPTDGRITWETRSLIWGFPDYTTAEIRADGLYIFARQRFGIKDFGVNPARLSDWLAQL